MPRLSAFSKTPLYTARSLTSSSFNRSNKTETKNKTSKSSSTESNVEGSNSELEKKNKKSTTSKTQAELDLEGIQRMEDHFGGRDTGEMHLDSDGKPSSIASGVKKNFFRYI